MPEPLNHPPSLLEFVKLNQPLNPHMTVPELARAWDKDWGHIDPKTLPSLDTFMKKNKPLNPHLSDSDLEDHWHDYFGSLGADAGGKARPITTRKDLTMRRLNTDEAPDPLILPEDPEDLFDIDPIEHLERLIDAGVPLDVIDQRMDAFFGRAPASTAPSMPRTLTPKARNNPPTNNLTPRSDAPSLDEFLSVAGPQNPHKSTRELVQYWNNTHGHVDPKTLPSLETFLPVMKEKNPHLSEHALTSYWRDRYGALGAPEKNNVATSPGVLSTAKALALKASGVVTNVPKMMGQTTAARTRQ